MDASTYLAGRTFRLLMDGELVPAASGATRQTLNPSTGEVLATVPEASAEDVARAVEAAERAQPAWAALGVRGRRTYFEALAQAVKAHREDLALLDALDAGNPLAAMRVDIDIALQSLADWPALALAHGGEVIDASPGNLHYTRYQPYGVVGRIVAYNHPALFALTRILPALITGNTVVLKPGVQTPLSSLAFGELARDILPRGVLNVVTGDARAGDALVTHPRVRRIAFTGSVPTGLAIQQRAATAGVKHVSLELGGKNAMIVFPDVEPEEAIHSARKGMNFEVCQGQSCGSTSRVFVHTRHYARFVEELSASLQRIAVGPAHDERFSMGPLISAEHLERVTGYVASGRADGAKLVTGGVRPAGLDRGYFMAPTLFAGVDMSMKIAREEIFGPVISVFPWDDYETMVRQVNAVDYGLTASLWTNDVHIAHRTAERMEAGYVWINDSSVHYWGTPFGGWKNSGLGREECLGELREYLQTKVVHTILKSPERALQRLGR